MSIGIKGIFDVGTGSIHAHAHVQHVSRSESTRSDKAVTGHCVKHSKHIHRSILLDIQAPSYTLMCKIDHPNVDVNIEVTTLTTYLWDESIHLILSIILGGEAGIFGLDETQP